MSHNIKKGKKIYTKCPTAYEVSGLLRTRCVVNSMNAPTRSQSFNAMFNLFQVQGG
jgi:hypothetical protein